MLAGNGAASWAAPPDTSIAAAGDPTVYVSSSGSGKVGGITFADEDVMAYDTVAGTWSMYFDGSDVGLGATDIDAIDIVTTGPTAVIDLSLEAPKSFTGIGTVDDSDVLRFTGTPGAVTSGTFALLIDGSDVGLTTNPEDIDALSATATGYAFSTFGNVSAQSVTGADEDLIGFVPTSTGTVTAGTLSMLLDGSTIGLGPKNLTATWIDQTTGKIYGSATAPFFVNGLAGDQDDVFAFDPSTSRATKYFDGDRRGYNVPIDALHIAPSPPNAAPVITTPPAVSVAEESTVAVDVQTSDDTDIEGDGLTYSLTGGADAAAFSLDADTGLLTFVTAPDFEIPGDAGGNNVYDVSVTVTDGPGLTDSVDLGITVTNITENIPPEITTPGAVSVPESTTAVVDIAATDTVDAEGAGLTYSLDGGADAAMFSIVPATGVITFLAAPDFEVPGDAGADNVYDVGVRVTDSGNLSDTLVLAVSVTDVYENTSPVIQTASTVSRPENQTAVVDLVTTDDVSSEGNGLTYAITGGADQARFEVAPSTGIVTFLVAPDFEVPTDADTNGVYVVQITVTDIGGLTGSITLSVTVTNVYENTPPEILTTTTVGVAENQVSVVDVQTTDDVSTEGGGLSYAITGGADEAAFSIVASTGVLTFLAPPDFEIPGDVGGNNVYNVTVTVTDVGGLTDVLVLAVTVTDVYENTAPDILTSGTVSVPEDTLAVVDLTTTDDVSTEANGGLSYGVTGGADQATFAVVPGTGVLRFVSPPDFENPTDANGDNVYLVTVTVTDVGGLTDAITLSVTVTDGPENAPPTIATAAAQTVPEGTITVVDVATTDDVSTEANGGLTYTITGGADQAHFAIAPSTGVVSFLVAPDFENPVDVGADNVYDIDVTVADAGGLTDVLAMTVTVTDSAETWGGTFGGASVDDAYATAVDGEGNTIVTGAFSGTVDADLGAGVSTLSATGAGTDVFVAKYDPQGGLLWAHRIGSTGVDVGRAVAVDAAGNVVLTGQFNGTVDFDPGAGLVSRTSNGGNDAFVIVLDADGEFAWGYGLGGTSPDNGRAAAVDASGNVYVAGQFRLVVDFNPGAGVQNLTSSGADDVFVARFAPNGDFSWALKLGGSTADIGRALTTDSTGNVIVAGQFTGTADFNPGPGVSNLASVGGDDAFVAKLDPAGALLWARAIGGATTDVAYSLARDGSDHVVVAGSFDGTVDLDPGGSTDSRSSAGDRDAFVVELDAAGGYVWGRTIGSTGTDDGFVVAIGAGGEALVGGQFSGTVDFDPGAGTTALTSNGGLDAYITRIDTDGALVWARGVGGIGTDATYGLGFDAGGGAVVTGAFQATVDLDPGPGTVNATSAGGDDAFVIQLDPTGNRN